MIIFLDIDGVLTTAEFLLSDCWQEFDPTCVAALNTLIAKTGAELVVSSAWREGRTVKHLQEILTSQGVEGTVIGKTPVAGKRGNEIKMWLHDNEYDGEFIVIDDEIAGITGIIPADKIVHVEDGLMKDGLTLDHLRPYLD